ncbi:hypothetical protein AT05_05185 [Schleiferia thermophila str. Yellowstone]|jgi:uncharacterized membrane protein|uniref:DUF1648 domain-containing protein n=1 Tax=Schleiferia thermophila TaxID=884107 RepID=A0A369A1T6_9FLAO|nr:hypothetical protein AT05_05185 [Schleiferia thermophila str. Yellowstone]RCX03155.1 hypothetical protein DES35_10333 [Schleiferia thermophila]GCD80283.1 hypothetical protein JCM30197_15300 [Schleiferia thermophila]
MVVKKPLKLLLVIDYLLESLAIVLIIISFFIVFDSYSRLPDEIYISYGLNGLPDKAGHKSNLYFLPFMALLLYALLSSLQKNPDLLLSPNTNDDHRRDISERFLIKLLTICKLIVSTGSLIIVYRSIWFPIGYDPLSPNLFSIIVFVILSVPIILLILKFAFELKRRKSRV